MQLNVKKVAISDSGKFCISNRFTLNNPNFTRYLCLQFVSGLLEETLIFLCKVRKQFVALRWPRTLCNKTHEYSCLITSQEPCEIIANMFLGRPSMSVESPLYRKYDHRVRNLIANSKDPHLFPQLKIPLSTARSWIKKGPVEVVTTPAFEAESSELVEKITRLENLLSTTKAESNLITRSVKILGFEIQYKRIPSEAVNESILSQYKEASKIVPIRKCLEIVGLSSMRYYSWLKRQAVCRLEDSRSCPRLTPSRITRLGLSKIMSYLTDSDLFPAKIYSF